jgi:hypothetical protein
VFGSEPAEAGARAMEPAKVRASLVPVSILCTAGVRRAELALERQAQRLGVRKAGGGWEQQSLSPDPACGQGVSDHQAGMLATAGPWEWAAAPFLQAPLQAMPLRLCGSPLGRAESVLMACPPPQVLLTSSWVSWSCAAEALT